MAVGWMHHPSAPAARPMRAVAPWLERMARVGYVANAVLYAAIGLLALGAASGVGGTARADSRAAMIAVVHAPLGRALLVALALGLLACAIWRVIEGIADPERRGRGARGVVLRIASVVTGLVDLALAYTAYCLVAGEPTASDSAHTKHWVARALDAPHGDLVLWAVALGFIGGGAYQVYCAITAKLDRRLDLGRVSRGAGRWIIGVSRFGIATRGVVFGTIGVLLARAAEHHDPHKAGGLSGSLREILTFGRWPFVAIALGLVAYGVYELLNAAYRRFDL